MNLPDYTDGKAKFILREKGLVSAIEGNCVGYVRTVTAEEFLANVAVEAGYKPGETVEYYFLIKKKR